MQLERESWVDNVKVFACVLVALGHLFQSLAPMLSQESGFLKWFDQTIYYFHVPLFFFCSGYLYQKYGKVDSIQSWLRNVKKKAFTLGIPYVVFTVLTWLLKTVFADEVNNSVKGLAHVLFVAPLSPYWYLYALFFVFFVTPTLKTKRVGLTVLTISAIAQVLGEQYGNDLPQVVKYLLFYEMWFVLGMVSCMYGVGGKKNKREVHGLLIAVVFIVLSVLTYMRNWDIAGLKLIMGLLGCVATIRIIGLSMSERVCKFAAYTMPVYLLHTICAAPVRIVLIKLQVSSLPIHIVAGIVASFLFPVLIAKIAAKTKWLEFWIYPGKYIKI